VIELLARRARLVVLATAAVTAVSLVVGGTVTHRMNGGNDQFADLGSESIRAFDALTAASGVQPDPTAIALVRRGSPAEVARRIETDEAVARTEIRGDLVLVYFRAGDESIRGGARRLLDGVGRDADVVLGGSAIAARQISSAVQEDLLRAELIAFPLVLLLSFWVFRGLVAALLPPLVGAAAIGLTFLALRGISERVELSVFSVNLVTGLGLGLAIDYSLLTVTRYREELARAGPGIEALRATMATAGRTVLVSALTVAAAMASLFVFPLQFLWSMALGGTIVALAAAAVCLGPLPALLYLLGPRVGALAPARWQRPPERRRWERLARHVMRRPGRIVLASGAILVALGLPALGVAFTGIDAKSLPEGISARELAEELDDRGLRGAASPLDLVFSARPPDDAAERARTLPGVLAVVDPALVGSELWRLQVLPREAPLAASTQRLVDRLRAAFPDARLTGTAAAYDDQLSSLAAHLPWAILALAVSTFILLFLFTGSVVLPLKALLMNLLTIGASFGVLVLVFQEWLGERGLESTQPILLCAVAFGLSTDYAIFLLSRIREARRRGLGDRAAVADGLERTGRVVTAAALLFCVAIGVFASSRLVFIQELGVGTAVAVALDATIVRALLVPGLMILLGRWNWWAPRPLRRLRSRERVSELRSDASR
jgi:RND superfamily putative drug exporter